MAPVQRCSAVSTGRAAEQQHEQQRGHRDGKGQRRHSLREEGARGRTRAECSTNSHEDAGFSQQPDLPIPRDQGECPFDRLAEVARDHHRAVGRTFHPGEDRGLHGSNHGNAKRPSNLWHAVMQNADEDQHPDFDEQTDLTSPAAGHSAQPCGNHHADEEGEQRRHKMKGLLPSRGRGIHPQKHQISRLSVRQNAVRYPGVGVDITTGERQHQRDQQGLLAVDTQVSRAHLKIRPDAFATDPKTGTRQEWPMPEVGSAGPKGLIWINGFPELDPTLSAAGGSHPWTQSNRSFQRRRKFSCCSQSRSAHFLDGSRFAGFAIGATACTLVVAVILGQLGTFVIPPLVQDRSSSACSYSRSATNRGPNSLLR